MKTFYILWFFILGFSVLLIFIRFLKGPTLQDRVIALDMFTTVSTSFLVMLSLFLENSYFLDVSLVYSIISFISVIAISKYLEGKVK